MRSRSIEAFTKVPGRLGGAPWVYFENGLSSASIDVASHWHVILEGEAGVMIDRATGELQRGRLEAKQM